MKYLVMECHESYAVVMDKKGRLIKAANLGYKVGEKLEKILPMQEKKEGKLLKFVLPVAAAACLCVIVAVWQFLWAPFGTVKIEINPQVLVTSNRMDKVIKVEGINEDGKTLIEGYEYKGKEFRTVTEELTQLADDMGYLKTGVDVNITVESDHDNWKLHAEEVLMSNLHIHEGKDISLTIDGVLLNNHFSAEALDEFGDELDALLNGIEKDDMEKPEDFDDEAEDEKLAKDPEVKGDAKEEVELKENEEPADEGGNSDEKAAPDDED